MRALKALVIVMGILILAGMGLVGYAVFRQAAGPRPGSQASVTRASTPAAPATPYGPVEVTLPAGARIVRSETDGERLVVELELATGGERMLVVDLATGAVIGTIDLKPQP